MRTARCNMRGHTIFAAARAKSMACEAAEQDQSKVLHPTKRVTGGEKAAHLDVQLKLSNHGLGMMSQDWLPHICQTLLTMDKGTVEGFEMEREVPWGTEGDT